MQELLSASDTSMQLKFDWDAKVTETKALIKEDAELTTTIDDAMVTRFQGRVKIGLNLIALQDDHATRGYGDFTTTILPDLGIEKQFAYRCIRVARLYRDLIVPSLVQSNNFAMPLPMDTWNKLASPSTPPVVIEQLLSGEVAPNPQSINEAIKRAEEAEKAEKLAHAKATLIQQQLLEIEQQHQRQTQQEQVRSASVIKKYDQQIAALKLEKTQITYKDTPETKIKLQFLENRSNELTIERDNEAARANSFAKKFQENLTKQKEENEYGDRIRQRWRAISNEFHAVLNRWYEQLPNDMSMQCFEAEDWARLDNMQGRAQRFVEDCQDLHKGNGMVIDAG